MRNLKRKVCLWVAYCEIVRGIISYQNATLRKCVYYATPDNEAWREWVRVMKGLFAEGDMASLACALGELWRKYPYLKEYALFDNDDERVRYYKYVRRANKAIRVLPKVVLLIIKLQCKYGKR